MSLTTSIYQCPRCMGYSSNPAICDHCKWPINKPFSVSSDTPICQNCKHESSDLSLGLCPYCIKRVGLKAAINAERAVHGDGTLVIDDPVNHPKHYCSHPSGIECITITRHFNFNIGNIIKYLWRSNLKDHPIQDLEKALWYLKDEINLRKGIEKTNG